MRIAIIRQRYTPFGGAERFVENALEALLERDVAITLYTREWPQTKLALIEPSIIDPFYLGSLWRDWGFQRGVCKAVSHARLDLVQSHERLCCCDIFRAGDGVHAVWLEERLRGAPALARLRVRLNAHHRYLLGMEKRMFASPWLSAVICNSQMVRDEIRERFGVADSKMHVIYSAVDTEMYAPAAAAERAAARERFALPADAIVYTLVGSGYVRKGVASAIRALAALPEHTHLLVVGADRNLRHYAQLARKLGLRGRVNIAGPQIDVKPYYAAADAFVLPTLYDPCPNAALEAMACGLPVVTSSKCGVTEIASAHDAGFACDARDVEALAAHMRTLLDPATRARMGANARNAALPLSSSAMTLKLVLLYKALLAASIAQRRPTS
ncbi:MAG: glycosyltransferase family 4 protein, partial [Casimicrobiaceae bacterium]